MTQEAAAKKDTQKLQRAIVDGLEDVKGQDIQVFNTEHLSPLFERVIVASGTSNRQTRALASSVIDAVRDAGFPKPRLEGEDNGEWIIVDCGAAVAHIMQPAIRQYYHLEEIWGEKPVRLRFGAAKPAAPAKAAAPAVAKKAGTSLRRSSAAKTAAREADREAAAAKKTPARKTGAKTAGAKTAAGTGRSAAGKTAATRTTASKTAAAKSTPAKKAPAKSGASSTARTAAGRTALKAPAKTAAKKAPAKSSAPRH
ncbi:MAG TPA: ribosome silencing factor [Ramlibacter sp.]|uniref:ribosome silencing factor n=1 Tax=Ramlibacter sp. TaxID=1917967 RepID=UPI002D7E7970|nr:ribosome silencing factor [Ramlibacter sp.]HET8744514.1 ribosome silencing factor [Ramlibacter sp.]